jgi:hypothetical protein
VVKARVVLVLQGIRDSRRLSLRYSSRRVHESLTAAAVWPLLTGFALACCGSRSTPVTQEWPESGRLFPVHGTDREQHLLPVPTCVIFVVVVVPIAVSYATPRQATRSLVRRRHGHEGSDGVAPGWSQWDVINWPSCWSDRRGLSVFQRLNDEADTNSRGQVHLWLWTVSNATPSPGS